MRTAILDAEARLVSMTGEGTSGDPPSTTVVAAMVRDLDVTVGWAGDSRAYWVAPSGESRQLTADHSWMNDVVTAGQMSLEQAEKAPQAHGITRWLGADAGENAQPDVINFKVADPGYLLLCTDGLWNYEPELKIGEEAGLLDQARHLVDFANNQGGHDNITVVLLRLGEHTE